MITALREKQRTHEFLTTPPYCNKAFPHRYYFCPITQVLVTVHFYEQDIRGVFQEEIILTQSVVLLSFSPL